MTKHPYMPDYVSDFFGSSRVRSCHGYAQGLYKLLLAHQWNMKGEGLPADPKKLARLCNITVEEWQAHSEEVLQFFGNRDGRLFNDRCDRDWKESVKRIEKARTAANKRWEKGDAKSMLEACDRICSNDDLAYAIQDQDQDQDQEEDSLESHLFPSQSLTRDTRAREESGSGLGFSSEKSLEEKKAVMNVYRQEIGWGHIKDSPSNLQNVFGTYFSLKRNKTVRQPLAVLRRRIRDAHEGKKDRLAKYSDADEDKARKMIKETR